MDLQRKNDDLLHPDSTEVPTAPVFGGIPSSTGAQLAADLVGTDLESTTSRSRLPEKVERLSPEELYALEQKIRKAILSTKNHHVQSQLIHYVAHQSIEDAWHLFQALDVQLVDMFTDIFCHPAIILKNFEFFTYFLYNADQSLVGFDLYTYMDAAEKLKSAEKFADPNFYKRTSRPNIPSAFDQLLADIDTYYMNYLSYRDIRREHAKKVQEFASTADPFMKELHSIMFMQGFKGMEGHPLAFTEGFYEVYLERIEHLKYQLIQYLTDKYGDQLQKGKDGRYRLDAHTIPSHMSSLVKALEVWKPDHMLSGGYSNNPTYILVHAASLHNESKTDLIFDASEGYTLKYALSVKDDCTFSIEGNVLITSTPSGTTKISSLQSPLRVLLEYDLTDWNACVGTFGGGTLREESGCVHFITKKGDVISMMKGTGTRAKAWYFNDYIHITDSHLFAIDHGNLYDTQGNVVCSNVPSERDMPTLGQKCYFKHMISTPGAVHLYYMTTNGVPHTIERTLDISTGRISVLSSFLTDNQLKFSQYLSVVESIQLDIDLADRFLHQRYLYTSTKNLDSVHIMIFDTGNDNAPIRDVELPLDNPYSQRLSWRLAHQQQQANEKIPLFPVSDAEGRIYLIHMYTGAIIPLSAWSLHLDTIKISSDIHHEAYYSIEYTDPEGVHSILVHKQSLLPLTASEQIHLIDGDDIYGIEVQPRGTPHTITRPATLSTQHTDDLQKISLINVLSKCNTDEERKRWEELERQYRDKREAREKENMSYGMPITLVSSLLETHPALFYDTLSSKPVENKELLTKIIAEELAEQHKRHLHQKKFPASSTRNRLLGLLLGAQSMSNRVAKQLHKPLQALHQRRGASGTHVEQNRYFDNTAASNKGGNLVEAKRNNMEYGFLSEKVDDFLTTSMYMHRNAGKRQKVPFPYHIATQAADPSREIEVSLPGGHFSQHYLEKGYNSTIHHDSLSGRDAEGNVVPLGVTANAMGELLVDVPENIVRISYVLTYSPSLCQATPITQKAYDLRKHRLVRTYPAAAPMLGGAEHLHVPQFFLPFLAHIKDDSPHEKLQKIQDFVALLFHYDDDQPAHLASLKADMSPDESLAACAYYIEELKRDHHKTAGKFTGVCVDHANLCYTLLCAAGFVCGVADGVLVNNQDSFGTQDFHRECYVIMPTPDGKSQYVVRVPIQANNPDTSLLGSLLSYFSSSRKQTDEDRDYGKSPNNSVTFMHSTDRELDALACAESYQAELLINIEELVTAYTSTDTDPSGRELIKAAIIQKMNLLDEQHKTTLMGQDAVASWIAAHTQAQIGQIDTE